MCGKGSNVMNTKNTFARNVYFYYLFCYITLTVMSVTSVYAPSESNEVHETHAPYIAAIARTSSQVVILICIKQKLAQVK
jgi:hypothetical protein